MTGVRLPVVLARLLLCLLLLGAEGGCQVGVGHGVVQGTLEVPVCDFNPPTSYSFAAANPYKMNPNFFVGQPIDADPIHAPGFPANQMVIRIQNSPERLESADALQFWILDSSEVARCMRGRMNSDGTPDWDPTLCDRSPASVGSSGEGRLFVGMTSETVRSFFSLKASCPKAYISADALGSCIDGSCPLDLCPGHGSWISFDQYGEVPADLSVPISPGFTVNFGENISASAFHVELCDVATVLAARDKIIPVPKPAIVGTLDGQFEFDLERGQAAQPFP